VAVDNICWAILGGAGQGRADFVRFAKSHVRLFVFFEFETSSMDLGMNVKDRDPEC
jgi:hypothetical protein